jgi:hypothetical protein
MKRTANGEGRQKMEKMENHLPNTAYDYQEEARLKCSLKLGQVEFNVDNLDKNVDPAKLERYINLKFSGCHTRLTTSL